MRKNVWRIDGQSANALEGHVISAPMKSIWNTTIHEARAYLAARWSRQISACDASAGFEVPVHEIDGYLTTGPVAPHRALQKAPRGWSNTENPARMAWCRPRPTGIRVVDRMFTDLPTCHAMLNSEALRYDCSETCRTQRPERCRRGAPRKLL